MELSERTLVGQVQVCRPSYVAPLPSRSLFSRRLRPSGGYFFCGRRAGGSRAGAAGRDGRRGRPPPRAATCRCLWKGDRGVAGSRP